MQDQALCTPTFHMADDSDSPYCLPAQRPNAANCGSTDKNPCAIPKLFKPGTGLHRPVGDEFIECCGSHLVE